jgi:alginate O-acetyltransferase complex protein AlgI
MIFNSITFVLFFAIVLVLHNLPFSWKTKKINLLVASYLFYAAWNPPFVTLLWITTLIDWYAAAALGKTVEVWKRRLLLAVSMSGNLGLLGFFKYGNFLMDNFVHLARMAGIEYHPPELDIILPIGISFYTFHSMSYTIDVYRRNYAPSKSFLDFCLYVTFFPALVAGPILRAKPFLLQCETPRRANSQQFFWGLSLMVFGLFGKIILADWVMRPTADNVFSHAQAASLIDAWAGVLAFSGQIYFDFAGYSLCAVGASMCLGFAIPDNFHFPYAAAGFSDFWRRWHISLSSWLRDYLYIPLGGNRKGGSRTYVNLLLTMLLGGLWHGASWRFVVWGGLHGTYLAAERFIRERWGDEWLRSTWARELCFVGVTHLLVLITWVFFRAQDMDSALHLLSVMFTGSDAKMLSPDNQVLRVLAATAFMLSAHWFLRHSTLEDLAGRVSWWLVSALIAGLMLTMFLNAGGDSRGFIYFQF